MNTLATDNTSSMARADFIDILNDEFTTMQGFGIFAFLSFHDIDALYNSFLDSAKPAKTVVKKFVKSYVQQHTF